MSKRQGNPTEFSNRLREMRRAANLTQVELAKKTELTYVYIGRLEKGISQPTADVIKRLAEGLGVTAGYLLDGSEPNVAGLELATFAALGTCTVLSDLWGFVFRVAPAAAPLRGLCGLPPLPLRPASAAASWSLLTALRKRGF
jgi:transcriptional regulator with XRE-family HTH domain